MKGTAPWPPNMGSSYKISPLHSPQLWTLSTVYVEKRRGKKRVFTLGDNFTPRGQSFHPWDHISHLEASGTTKVSHQVGPAQRPGWWGAQSPSCPRQNKKKKFFSHVFIHFHYSCFTNNISKRKKNVAHIPGNGGTMRWTLWNCRQIFHRRQGCQMVYLQKILIWVNFGVP
jgi:hypothetical protein